ncbi:MAG: hypothetical protein RR420_01475 [Anaerovoracaceae bacterium]
MVKDVLDVLVKAGIEVAVETSIIVLEKALVKLKEVDRDIKMQKIKDELNNCSDDQKGMVSLEEVGVCTCIIKQK